MCYHITSHCSTLAMFESYLSCNSSMVCTFLCLDKRETIQQTPSQVVDQCFAHICFRGFVLFIASDVHAKNVLITVLSPKAGHTRKFFT